MLPAPRHVACSGLNARDELDPQVLLEAPGFAPGIPWHVLPVLALGREGALMGALMDELARLLGPDGLRALSAARGGRRARIPKRVPSGHWLERAVGRELARRMAWCYGGCRVYVPRSGRPERDRRIRELRRQGCSIPTIATEAGLSERRVQQILARGGSG